MSELPSGWGRAEIGDLCNLINGRAFKPQEWSEFGLPIIRIQNLNNADAKFNNFSGTFDAKHHVKNGDLLFAWSGTPGTSFGAHIWHGGDSVLNQHIFKIEFSELEINRGFLRYAINQKLDELIGSAQGGVGLRHVTKGTFEKTEIVFPPRAEQTRIAAKLDELLAQIDTLKARIDGIPALLKRFRQSVLAAAVSGRLTEEWRAGNSNPGWSEIKLEDLLAGAKDGICRGPFGSSIKKEYFVPEGYKVYEQKNAIRDNSLIGEYFVDEKKYKELERFSVRSGDFIVSCAGTLGRISLLPSNAPAGLINQALIRIRTNKKLVLDEYFLLLFKSPSFQEKLVVGARGGAMQNLASTKEIKALEINCPTILSRLKSSAASSNSSPSPTNSKPASKPPRRASTT